jgi:hypothetical protein
LIEEEGSETAEYEIDKADCRVSVGASEYVNVGGEDIEAYVLNRDMDIRYTITDEDQQIETEMVITVESRELISKNTFRTVGMKETSKEIITATYGDEFGTSVSVIETETVTEDEYLEIEYTGSFPMKVGDKWTYTVTYSSTMAERSRYKYDTEPYSDWDEFTFEDTMTEPREFEVVSSKDMEVPSGTFEVFEITSQVPGEFEMEVEYMDASGLIVQMESRIDSEPELIMKLKEFKMDNRKDSDEDGVMDFRDAFPTDKAASVDKDGDGYPDEWNEGMTEEDSSTALILDQFPDDPTRWSKSEDSPFGNILLLVGAVMVIAALMTVIGIARKR